MNYYNGRRFLLEFWAFTGIFRDHQEIKWHRIVKWREIIKDRAGGNRFRDPISHHLRHAHRNQESKREMEGEKSPSVSVLLLIISNSVVNDEGCSYHHYRSGTEPVFRAQGHCGLRADYVFSSAVLPPCFNYGVQIQAVSHSQQLPVV